MWRDGKVHDLGTLGGSFSQANSINDLGEVAGYSDGTAGVRAFFWSPERGMRDLGTLSGGHYSQGIAINLQGDVAGFSNAADGQWHGFLWTKSGGMQALPNLPRATSASADGINDLGQVVGGSGSHAVLWNKSGDAENLEVVPGQTWSTAFAINGLGQVVGWLVGVWSLYLDPG